MKAIVVILILAAAIYWAYSHKYIKPEWLGLGQPAGTAPASSGAAGASLRDTLNRGLPRMLNSEISVDRAGANNQLVTFDYRFIDLDQYAVAQRYGSTMPAELQGTLIRDLCANRDVREQVLARGGEVVLRVHSQDGRTVFSGQLRPGGC